MRQNVWQKRDLKIKDQFTSSLLQRIHHQIEPYSSSPYLDALVLLGFISGKTKSQLLADPSPELTHQQQSQLNKSLNQIKDHIPLPYVIGTWEFYQLPFIITPDVLIPRPETEGLVERAIDWLENSPSRRTCLELGTGSGCIAVTLVKRFPDLMVLATDFSYPALLIARKNARQNKAEDNINFLVANLLAGFQIKIDLLITNLPYIPIGKLKSLPVYQTEPRLALDGGIDGLSQIREVLENVSGFLNPGGLILMEIDEGKGPDSLDTAHANFPNAEIWVDKDLTGMDRYLRIQTQ